MNALRGVRIGVVGTGKMGQALIGGLLAQGVRASQLAGADAEAATRRLVAGRFRIRVSADTAAMAGGSQLLILAVKPQQFPALLRDIAPHVRRGALVVSIAAGITLRWLTQRLPGVAVARVMPNLPATVGCGFSALTFGRGVAARHRAQARALCEAVGQVVELPERQFDAVTAVSGSGPAYVFFLVAMWEEAARSLGLPPAVASQAIRQTLAGSSRLFEQSGEPASVLIGKVASKGGTTEAALKVLANRRVELHFREALRAAARRSQQLSWS